MDNQLTDVISKAVIQALSNRNNPLEQINEVPIAVSNRHVHLSREALERLFGRSYELKKWKELSQPGQFAAQETVDLIGPKGIIRNVRVLGPSRGETQVEISLFDGFTLGSQLPIRDSGDLADSPPITIQGPRGQLKLDRGLICAARHIHMHPNDAAQFGVSDGQRVSIHVPGTRAVTFHQVLIRVSPKYKLEMHIDLDEANAANLKTGQIGYLSRA
jgi:putative phosphotransacetylase